jgi:hypothetical protein
MEVKLTVSVMVNDKWLMEMIIDGKNNNDTIMELVKDAMIIIDHADRADITDVVIIEK